jgi:CelD/BcsL family acetyltransferase involved in cellulose biosynthesis
VPLSIALQPVTDWEELGQRWRDLEQRARASFFQSWTWTGCLAAERFDRPLLLCARQDNHDVALALFNHRRGLLCDSLLLNETGDPGWDSVFIEHNGILAAGSAPSSLLTACIGALGELPLPDARALFGRRIVLSGVDASYRTAPGPNARIVREQRRDAPLVDLAALRRAGKLHTDLLSSNARSQLRRSLRHYAREGPLCVTAAESPADAHGYLDALARWHQRIWQQRGKPGAFANPRFVRFHHALLDRALPRQELMLLRISAGPTVIGYLYNFRHRGRVLAYQSGFDYESADKHQKPGLTCHHLAIEQCLAAGDASYDFLAGADRYKRSLSDGDTQMYWLVLAAPSPVERVKRWLRATGRRGRTEGRAAC